MTADGHSFRVTNNGSGFDGAMDDVAESTALVSPNRSPSAKSKSPAKGSPSKMSATTDASPSSPSKKSPVKAKLQNLADRAKGGSKKDKQLKQDPSTMNPEEKRRWKEEWKEKFRDIRKKDREEVKKYKQENPLPPQ